MDLFWQLLDLTPPDPNVRIVINSHPKLATQLIKIMATLLELGQIRDALVEMIFDGLETAGEDPATQQILADQLADLENQIANKVDAIVGILAAKQAEINYLAERREHFDRLVKSRQNAVNRFKDYLKSSLEQQGVSSMAGKEAKLRLVKNGGKAPVWIDDTIDPRKFPSDCVIESYSCSVSTEFIRERLTELGTNDLIVDGQLLAKVQERGTHLRIG